MRGRRKWRGRAKPRCTMPRRAMPHRAAPRCAVATPPEPNRTDRAARTDGEEFARSRLDPVGPLGSPSPDPYASSRRYELRIRRRRRRGSLCSVGPRRDVIARKPCAKKKNNGRSGRSAARSFGMVGVGRNRKCVVEPRGTCGKGERERARGLYREPCGRRRRAGRERDRAATTR